MCQALPHPPTGHVWTSLSHLPRSDVVPVCEKVIGMWASGPTGFREPVRRPSDLQSQPLLPLQPGYILGPACASGAVFKTEIDTGEQRGWVDGAGVGNHTSEEWLKVNQEERHHRKKRVSWPQISLWRRAVPGNIPGWPQRNRFVFKARENCLTKTSVWRGTGCQMWQWIWMGTPGPCGGGARQKVPTQGRAWLSQPLRVLPNSRC